MFDEPTLPFQPLSPGAGTVNTHTWVCLYRAEEHKVQLCRIHGRQERWKRSRIECDSVSQTRFKMHH